VWVAMTVGKQQVVLMERLQGSVLVSFNARIDAEKR
jgi:hypothetical protein